MRRIEGSLAGRAFSRKAVAGKRLAAGGLVLAVAGAAGIHAQQAAAPVARYEMRAETVSGLGGMGAMGGGGASGGGGGIGSAMAMMMGGGARKAQHVLWLELGSSRAPADGKPKAEHFMPAGALLGKSVQLKTPVATPSGPQERDVPDERQFQRPKGRMLIFWGCGEHAPKGQPVVIDFSKMAAGQIPPGLFTTTIPVDRTVSPRSSRTYGHWPSDDGKVVRPESALVGAHRVAGNYSPDIAFTLGKDFMAAINASNTAQASGATLLRWNAIPDATGFHASIVGGKQAGRGGDMADIVWWSSSATRQFGGGLSDWIAPATAARLVADKTLLAPQTTSCLVPAEVKAAAPDFMYGTLNAFGPEESFAFPPRPADPKARWTPEWTARIRHKATTGFLVGMDMNAMQGMDADANERPACKPKKRGFGGLLGGALGGAIGVPTTGDGC